MPIISNKIHAFQKYHFIFRENSIILQNGELPDAETMKRCLELNVASDWFSELDHEYTVINLESDSPNPKNCEDIPLREFFHKCQQNPESEKLIELSSRAKGLLNFKNQKRFCSICGSPLHDDKEFTARTCDNCGHQYFPQLEPAVIVLVNKGDEYLLAKHKNRTTNFWTTLAGFVEIGETIENAVHREIFEETGIKVKNIRYVSSQAWPYPDQLMLAFRAEYDSGEIKVQEDEIQEAKWFNKNEHPTIPPPGSVAHNLITGVFG